MKGFGWIIAAVGGYYILEQMGILPNPFGTVAGTTTTTGNPTSTTTATTTNTTTTNTPTSTVSQNQTMNAIQAAMVKANDDPTQYHTVYEWNYYYTQVRGVQGPDPNMLFPGNPSATSELFSFSEWWSAMTGNGFSGMGAIAHHVNPYNNPMGTQFGSYLMPTGMEKWGKVIN